MRVTYLEQTCRAAPRATYRGSQRVTLERMTREAYLTLLLRDPNGDALGFCEFERTRFPQIQLKIFGLIAQVQGRGLGPWLRASALEEEWRSNPDRIWLHTDEWDHPAAVRIYERARFRVFDIRDQPPGSL